MNKKIILPACMIALIALIAIYQTALAHEHITIGDYELEIGWVDEPPVVGQKNGILVIVMDTSSGEAQPIEDISSLEVSVSYGGQTKELTLQPLGEDTPGQFMAPIVATVPGQYMVILGGMLGETALDEQVEPEEVASADTLQFPGVEATEQSAVSTSNAWLTWLAVLLALVGIGVGVTALRKAG